MPAYDLGWQLLWGITPSSLQAHSVEAAVEAAEKLAADWGTLHYNRSIPGGRAGG